MAEKDSDVDWFPWHLAVLLYVSGWVPIMAGVVLGFVGLARRSRQQTAGAL